MSAIRKIFDSVAEVGRKRLTLYESLYVIREYGLYVTNFILIKNTDDVDEIIGKIRFPVAVKVSSSDIIHKSDVGGVVLNIRSVPELKEVIKNISNRIRESFPNAYIDGFIVQEMVDKGYEVIIGGLFDEQFGPVVMFGLGGIFVEVFKDVAFDIAPIGYDEALDLIKQIKGYKILRGYRGKPSIDFSSLAKMISSVSYFLWDYREYIKELDLNPVFATQNGSFIVDSRIILK